MKYKVNGITTKVITTDEYGDVIFAIKITVKNNSDDEDVYFTLQGVDAEGFEIEAVHFSTEFPVGETRTLTTREEMNAKLYEQIVDWQVE